MVLVGSRVQVADDIDTLLATHHRLGGRHLDHDKLPGEVEVVAESHTGGHRSLVVRADPLTVGPSCSTEPVDLEELVLAYMTRAVHGERRLEPETGPR